ncbi:receptor-like protein kinase FERONIA [Tanacetum coccineum]
MNSTTGKGDRISSTISAQHCHRFTLAEIQSATEDFDDDDHVIGKGGFGKVYKAHLVSLIGFCDDNNEMIFVYEYIPNGTLYDHLHKDAGHLNWIQRLKIAIGAGRGLDYLHTGIGTHHGVIHRDVKSSNILLNVNGEAMISDFGLSKLGLTNQSSSYTDASVKGTFCYLDPEYFYTGKLTRKTDVYAFGVVLFELLTGRPAIDLSKGEDQCSLVYQASGPEPYYRNGPQAQPSKTVNIVDDHRQHHLEEKKKNPNYNATYNLYGFAWAFKIWILESYPNSKQWWSKKDNVIPRCLAWTNITKFDKSHYNRLFGPDSIPIVNLDPTPAEKIQAWFDSSIPYFNGIVDEDGKGCGDDYVLVSKDNSVDEDSNVCEDASAGLSKDEIVNDKLVDEDCNVCDDAFAGLSKDNAVNEKSVGNNDQLLLEDGDGLFDSEAGCRNSEEDNENQPANVSIRDLYAVIKGHEERIANLERLLKEKPPND